MPILEYGQPVDESKPSRTSVCMYFALAAWISSLAAVFTATPFSPTPWGEDADPPFIIVVVITAVIAIGLAINCVTIILLLDHGWRLNQKSNRRAIVAGIIYGGFPGAARLFQYTAYDSEVTKMCFFGFLTFPVLISFWIAGRSH